jgi:hypothetical protein
MRLAESNLETGIDPQVLKALLYYFVSTEEIIWCRKVQAQQGYGRNVGGGGEAAGAYFHQ